MPQMQLLDAFAREPGFRPEAYEKAKSVAPMLAGQIAGQPAATYYRGAQQLMVGNDPRYAQVPSNADLASVGAQDLAALLRRPLAGQAEVVMVGDLTVDQAIAATGATFGAGPGGARVPVGAAHVAVAAGRAAPYLFEHGGRADQAFYGEFFRLPDYFADPKTAVVADVAAAILESRMIDTVREALGLTYSPNADAQTAIDLPGEGYLNVSIETPPANFSKFHALLEDQIRDLASKPVAADELLRAKQPLIESERKKRETNAYWVTRLAQIDRDPRVEAVTLEQLDKMSAVTAADVQQMMGKYVAGHQPVVVIAKAKTADGAAAAK
jgi:zinc protease